MVRELPDELKKTMDESIDPALVRQLWVVRRQQKVTGEDLEFSCEIPRTVFHIGESNVEIHFLGFHFPTRKKQHLTLSYQLLTFCHRFSLISTPFPKTNHKNSTSPNMTRKN